MEMETVSTQPEIDERRSLMMSLQALLNPDMLAIVAALHAGERPLVELAELTKEPPSFSRGPLGRMIFLELIAVRKKEGRLLCSLNHARLRELNGALQRLSRDLFADDKRSAVAEAAAHLDEQEQRVLRTYLRGEQLLEIPSAPRRLMVVLRWLAEQFEQDRRYHEREVNELLKRHHPDSAALRRHLVDFRLMARASDYYWRRPAAEALTVE